MATPNIESLTEEEATQIVKEIVRTSRSEAEIRRRLTEAGFNGNFAAVTTLSHGSMFMAMVMVYGPGLTIISA